MQENFCFFWRREREKEDVLYHVSLCCTIAQIAMFTPHMIGWMGRVASGCVDISYSPTIDDSSLAHPHLHFIASLSLVSSHTCPPPVSPSGLSPVQPPVSLCVCFTAFFSCYVCLNESLLLTRFPTPPFIWYCIFHSTSAASYVFACPFPFRSILQCFFFFCVFFFSQNITTLLSFLSRHHTISVLVSL